MKQISVIAIFLLLIFGCNKKHRTEIIAEGTCGDEKLFKAPANNPFVLIF
jgi:hypothetical protein